MQRLPSAVRRAACGTAFDGALQQTRRILESDYKAAIPQYYNHSIQLLIPICLQNPGIPDLALACMKTPDGTKYLGRTCLTLRMAYHNARLLARLDGSWLRREEVRENEIPSKRILEQQSESCSFLAMSCCYGADCEQG